MISIEEALNIIEDNIPELTCQEVALTEAAGHYLAEDITAPEPSPRYTNSAMDGFVVRWQDVAPASEGSDVDLVIAGESRAGIPFDGTLQSGQAVRISTGAMVPEGADTVVRVEDTSERDGKVIIHAVRKEGQDIRFQGEEFQTGEVLLEQNTKLGPAQMALLASIGCRTVEVIKRPVVSVIVTGTELTENEEIAPHQIRDSNSIMLSGQIRAAGAVVGKLLRIGDSLEATIDTLRLAEAESDIIILSGGVSVGPHDHVKEAAETCGFEKKFWRIKQKPGKPLYFARKGTTLLFGLPGNPVSAFFSFSFYLQPLLAAMCGAPFSHVSITAVLAEDVHNKGKRPVFLCVGLEEDEEGLLMARLPGGQGSYMLTSIAGVDGFVPVEAEGKIPAGSEVTVYLF